MRKRLLQQRERRVFYFAPGQLMFLVEHPKDDERYGPQQLIALIKEKSYAVDRLRGAIAKPGRVVTCDHGAAEVHCASDRTAEQQQPRRFLPGNRAGQAFDVWDLRRASQEQFSLVYFDLQEGDRDPKRLTALIDELNLSIRGELAQLIKEQGTLQPGQFLVRSAAPNWLAGPSQNFGATGGPGARPAPADEDDFPLTLINLPAFDGKQGSEKVEVAILDTATSEAQLRTAYDTWVAGKEAPHPLLHSLLDNGGAFDVSGAGRLKLVTAAELGVDLPGPGEFRVRDHDYPMSDHGLFAAGVINSLAPNARLRLIQVLNEYGIGTLESIVRGLWLLVREREGGERQPLVVNMSLTLAMPLEGHPRTDFNWAMPAPDEQLLALALEWMCAALRDRAVSLVAAAGNDADEPDAFPAAARPELRRRGCLPWLRRRGARSRLSQVTRRPQARYPAAFPTVLGVGALLEGSDQPTDYSNLSDSPVGAGVWTFGGKAVDDEVGPGSGMLGVYIGGFPTEKDPSSPEGAAYQTVPSATGWGWWAGTSFAAPVISGTLAALVGQPGTPDLPTAELQLEGALRAVSTIGGVFPAKQGGA